MSASGSPVRSALARSRTSPRIRSVVGHADVGEEQRLLERRPRSRRRCRARAPQPGERGAGLAQPVAECGGVSTSSSDLRLRGARVRDRSSSGAGRLDGGEAGRRRARPGRPADARRGSPSTSSARWRDGTGRGPTATSTTASTTMRMKPSVASIGGVLRFVRGRGPRSYADGQRDPGGVERGLDPRPAARARPATAPAARPHHDPDHHPARRQRLDARAPRARRG